MAWKTFGAGLATIGLAAIGFGVSTLGPRSHGDGAEAEPMVGSSVLISALFFDGYAERDADEAVQLWNVSAAPVDLSGWSLADGEGTASFPVDRPLWLPAAGYLWLAATGPAFRASFGRPADWAWASDGAMAGRLVSTNGGPKLGNTGDNLSISDARGRQVDALVYGSGPAPPGWTGPPLWPFHTGQFAAAHQVLYRKLDPETGRPLVGNAESWASDESDLALGRRARWPGWGLEDRWRPAVIHEPATVEVAIAPDGLYGFLARHLAAARSSIDAEVYTLENPDLAELIAARARAGVAVRMLLDGAPVGGFDPNQRWATARVAAAGAGVAFMADGGVVGERYRSLHSKLIVIDGRDVLIGTENPNLGSTPTDDLIDGTAGRRGMYVAISSPSAAAWAAALLAEDRDAARFLDVRPYQSQDPVRGGMAPGFEPLRVGGGAGYGPHFAEPLAVTEAMTMVLQTAPENALDRREGLLALVGRAGDGDRVLVMQMDEPQWWGGGPAAGPIAQNPRWSAYLDAARRGAEVRVLLDSFFDDAARPNSNFDGARALNALARAEGLDLEARTGNPTGQGIHAKLVLVVLEGRSLVGQGPAEYWTHLGSLNGSEVAHKVNREVAINLMNEAILRRLEAVFAFDWAESVPRILYLPAGIR